MTPNPRNPSPFEGQWKCTRCGRTYGRNFKFCWHCPREEKKE